MAVSRLRASFMQCMIKSHSKTFPVGSETPSVRRFFSADDSASFRSVGFIGLGNMGSRMANNLIKAGYKMVVHDINCNTMKKYSDMGVATKETPFEVAEASDVVITMLPSPSHVLDVYNGSHGLLHGGYHLRPWLLIDSSTIDPRTSRELSAIVSSRILKEKKDSWENPVMLDAPVSGGVLAADAGTLTFMVGGSEEAYHAAKALFLSMGKSSVYCGGAGNGSDVEFMKNKIEDIEKSMKRSNDKQLKIELECCQKVKASLEEGKDVRLGDWKAADVEILNTFQLLTAKPVVYLVNMTEKDYQRKKNKFLPKIHAWVQEHGGETIIPFSGVLERNLADMSSPDEVSKYCEENKIQSALPKIIKTGFSAINLIYFFTAGPDEVKCWQIRRQTKAPQAAGTIHTDFERGFICAEVMKFEDLKELGSETAVKAAGKYKQEGKTYVVQDGDIIFFKFNVSGGGKK